MFCFGILRIFGGNHKKRKTRKSGKNQAPMSQRREPTPRRRPTPRRGIPHRDEAEVPKWHPSGMPRRSKATPWRRSTPKHSSATPRRGYCS